MQGPPPPSVTAGRAANSDYDRYDGQPTPAREHEAPGRNHANLDPVANYRAKSPSMEHDAGTPLRRLSQVTANCPALMRQLDAT
jgi:hypothetical protein